MRTVDSDTTLEYTKSLHVLYVEDDENLRQETQGFFEVFFNSVTLAGNGEEALQLYKEKSFDILITDIKMPKMDGIELAKSVLALNPEQSVIVTSAYNDTEYLMQFINLNIKQFMLKPVEVDNMLQVLYSVSKNIVNAKRVEEYRKKLEQNNNELKEKNDELHSLIRILDAKLSQLSMQENTLKMDPIDFMSIPTEDLSELRELEEDISGAAVLIGLNSNVEASNIVVLGNMFLAYAQVLAKYSEYTLFTKELTHLATSLQNTSDCKCFIEKQDEISVLLESLIYVLRMWRRNLVNHDTKKSFELHASMINDINNILTILEEGKK